MAARLDRSQPYGETWGGNGGVVCLEQNHKRFNLRGNEIDDDGNEIPDDLPVEAAPKGKGKGKGKGKAAAAEAQTEAQTATTTDAAELEDMSDEDLQTMVETAGGVWTDRETAIAMLSEPDAA